MTAAATEVSFPIRLLGSVIHFKTRDLLQQDECGLAGQLRALSGIDLEHNGPGRGAPAPTNLPGFYPAVYPKRACDAPGTASLGPATSVSRPEPERHIFKKQ